MRTRFRAAALRWARSLLQSSSEEATGVLGLLAMLEGRRAKPAAQTLAGPSRPSKRDELIEHTGQALHPAIEFEDGTLFREESKDME